MPVRLNFIFIKNNIYSISLLLFSIMLIILVALALTTNNNFTDSLDDKELFRVKSIIDGDTILLENGHQVRYLGIDTPETHHPEVGLECYGKEATDYNKLLTEKKLVYLIKDKTDKDKYGRLLRYVYTEDGNFVNYEIVSKGYAQVLSIPPDTFFQKKLLHAQSNAVDNNLGIWKTCFNYN